MILGITGKSGVGKSTLATQLTKHGYDFHIIHIDDISHKAMESDIIKNKLLDIFGEAIIQNGVINRKYLGDLVFTNRHLYDKISNDIWSKTKELIDDEINKHNNIILDWILLPHSHYWKICDIKILITADEDDRISHVLKRDNISSDYLKKRDSAGISYADIDFDIKIHNHYDTGGIPCDIIMEQIMLQV